MVAEGLLLPRSVVLGLIVVAVPLLAYVVGLWVGRGFKRTPADNERLLILKAPSRLLRCVHGERD